MIKQRNKNKKKGYKPDDTLAISYHPNLSIFKVFHQSLMSHRRMWHNQTIEMYVWSFKDYRECL